MPPPPPGEGLEPLLEPLLGALLGALGPPRTELALSALHTLGEPQNPPKLPQNQPRVALSTPKG